MCPSPRPVRWPLLLLIRRFQSQRRCPVDEIGPAATGVAVAGKAPFLSVLLDMNGDGILDIRQPEQIAKALANVLTGLAPLIPGGGGLPLTLAVQLLPKIASVLPPVIGGDP